MAPEFLSLEDVLAIHAESIRRFGGALGVRDTGALEAAIAVPQATMFGALLHPTLEEQAAAYLFHLVKDHAFVDGNKRTGLGAALLYLGLNHRRVVATNNELVDLTLSVATGKITKSAVAVFFSDHAEDW